MVKAPVREITTLLLFFFRQHQSFRHFREKKNKCIIKKKMFKFNFSKDSSKDHEENKSNEKELNWLPAKKIDIPQKYSSTNCEEIDYIVIKKIPNFPIKIIDREKIVIKLTEENCENIIEAESQHSDLLPAKYEGGLKVWEGTYDLTNYLFHKTLKDNFLYKKKVLDLGCGTGIIGIFAFLQGSIVHFQDYNAEVIESLTIPNVIMNSDNYESVKSKCEFYSGDWESFMNLLPSDENEKYDIIFTSETIYNLDNHNKLYQVFKQKLKKDGVGFIAAKTYYFGVGGGIKQFEELIKRDGVFNVTTVWKSNEGLQRQILQIKRMA